MRIREGLRIGRWEEELDFHATNKACSLTSVADGYIATFNAASPFILLHTFMVLKAILDVYDAIHLLRQPERFLALDREDV